ncbi:MAG: hypothetical protein ABL888_16180 [Pirellulaceae bacterium]
MSNPYWLDLNIGSKTRDVKSLLVEHRLEDSRCQILTGSSYRRRYTL